MGSKGRIPLQSACGTAAFLAPRGWRAALSRDGLKLCSGDLQRFLPPGAREGSVRACSLLRPSLTPCRPWTPFPSLAAASAGSAG